MRTNLNLIIPRNYKPLLGVKETEHAIKDAQGLRRAEPGHRTEPEPRHRAAVRPGRHGHQRRPQRRRDARGLSDQGHARRAGGNRPVAGQVEAHGARRTRLQAGLRPLHRHERPPAGRDARQHPLDLRGPVGLGTRHHAARSATSSSSRKSSARSTRSSSAPSISSANGTRTSARSCRRKSPSSMPRNCARSYPKLTPKQREHRLLRECGAAFIIGIGGDLGDGTIHDGRAPDYDDWSTPTPGGRTGLNGDILVWNPVLQDGVRVVLDGHPRGQESAAAAVEDPRLHGTARSCSGTRSSSNDGCRCPSAAASANRGSACISCAKRTSAKSRPASGRTR